MKFTLISSHRSLVFWMVAPLVVLLQACAQKPQPRKTVDPPPPPPPLQFLVYASPGTGSKSMLPDAFAQHASRIAEVPVRHEGLRADGRHNLVLVCANVPTCRVATQRLRGQAEFFASVEEAPRGVFGP